MARIAVPAALILALIFYYKVDPASPFMPRCAFRMLTGYDCPGCGFQRALHAALHGNIAEAWRLNAFVFFAVPAGAFYIVVEGGRERWPRFHARAAHPAIITALLIAVIAWWIGRNILL